MRLICARALTVALAVLGGAAAMAFPKLILADAVPEAGPISITARTPDAVTVIRVAPLAPAPARASTPRRTAAKPRPVTSTPARSSAVAWTPPPLPVRSRPRPPRACGRSPEGRSSPPGSVRTHPAPDPCPRAGTGSRADARPGPGSRDTRTRARARGAHRADPGATRRRRSSPRWMRTEGGRSRRSRGTRPPPPRRPSSSN